MQRLVVSDTLLAALSVSVLNKALNSKIRNALFITSLIVILQHAIVQISNDLHKSLP